mmetsp:Transcript_96818/g.255708  ORF Transcript_96818/g.255708 Transcript_96818/m.255708 type:complete len:201 (+) Transcript_96818:448-1050(+)
MREAGGEAGVRHTNPSFGEQRQQAMPRHQARGKTKVEPNVISYEARQAKVEPDAEPDPNTDAEAEGEGRARRVQLQCWDRGQCARSGTAKLEPDAIRLEPLCEQRAKSGRQRGTTSDAGRRRRTSPTPSATLDATRARRAKAVEGRARCHQLHPTRVGKLEVKMEPNVLLILREAGGEVGATPQYPQPRARCARTVGCEE